MVKIPSTLPIKAEPSGWIPKRATAIKIALIYALIGGLWILASGWLLHVSVRDREIEAILETAKGWVFILVTAAILGFALDRYFAQIRYSALKHQESEIFLRQAAAAGKVGLWDWDMRTNQVFYSPEWKWQIGHENDEIAGNRAEWESRLHPDDREAVLENVRKAIQDLSLKSEMEFRLRHKDGSYRWILAHASVIADADGRPARMLGSHIDISERKKTEATLRQWADAFKNCAFGIAMALPDTNRILVCNPAFAGMLGRSTEDIGGSPFISLFAPEDRTSIEPHIAQSDHVGQVRLETRMVRGDSASFPVQIDLVSVRDESGKVLYRVATVQNIAERKEKEELLRQRLELQDRFAKIGNTVPGMIYSFLLKADNSFCMPFTTPIIRQLFGVDPEDVQDDFSKAMAHVHSEDLDRLTQGILESARTLKPWRETFRVNHPERGEIWLEGNSMPRLEPDGSVLWSGFVQDVTERRLSEEALRESEARYRLISENSSDVIWLYDPAADRFSYVSPSVERVLGFTVEEMLRQNVRDSLTPDSVETIAEIFQVRLAAFSMGDDSVRTQTHELHQRCKNGAVVPVEIVTTLIADEQRRVTHIQGVTREIAKRKQVEEALRQSEERYRGLVETAFDWIWEINAEGRYTYASKKVESLLGYRPEEVLGRTPFDFMPEPEATRIKKQFEEIAARRQSFSALENTCQHKNGNPIIIEASGVPMLDSDGRLLGYRGMDRDITARKEAEAALVASEERLRTLVENAPIGLFVQTDKKFAYLNQSAVRLMGAKTAAELIGRPVLDQFHPDVQDLVEARMCLVNEHRQSVPLAELRCIRLDGAEFDAEFSAVPFVFDGKPGSLAFFKDVTERNQLEIQLRQAQKLEGIGQLAGGVAHDFNNILAAIMMNLGLLQMNPSLDEEIRHAIQDLEGQAQRAATLTRQLLMFSRRSVLSMKSVNLNDLVNNLLKMLMRMIGEHMDLRFESKNDLPPVEADTGLLEQVLMNLVVNARDAMPKGGRITIRTSLAEFGDDAGGDRKPGRFVCLTVSDTGCGMDAVTLKRLFEPFFTTKEVGKGTGLGLATMHGIIAQHKGWIEVESAIGAGTTFQVFLPALKPNQAEKGDVWDSIVQGGRETILVVEDDRTVRQLTAQSLERLGYRVHEAANGQEAIAVWEVHGLAIDLILTDMVMPEGLTGLDLIHRLQSQKPGLKAIIASGYSSEIVHSGMRAKAGILYLPKPYETKVLANAIRNCLDPPA